MKRLLLVLPLLLIATAASAQTSPFIDQGLTFPPLPGQSLLVGTKDQIERWRAVADKVRYELHHETWTTYGWTNETGVLNIGTLELTTSCFSSPFPDSCGIFGAPFSFWKYPHVFDLTYNMPMADEGTTCMIVYDSGITPYLGLSREIDGVTETFPSALASIEETPAECQQLVFDYFCGNDPQQWPDFCEFGGGVCCLID